MKEILTFLAREGAFLYTDHGFKITDSGYDPMFGGVGYVTLTDGVLDLSLWLDRDRLLVDFDGHGRRSTKEWFDSGLVRQLLTGGADLEKIDTKVVKFLKAYLSEIRRLFAPENLTETRKTLRKLRRQRTDRLFGPTPRRPRGSRN